MTQSVLITGCSSGIGRALALEFHQRGFVVYATARRLDALSPLEDMGIRCLTLEVNDSASVQAAARVVAEEQAGLDVLVNNAGFAVMGPVVELDPARIMAQLDTNSVAPVRLTQAFLGLLRARHGRVVNIGSVSGVLITPFSGAYGASKAALHSLSHALRMELAPFGIRVITVQPGAIRSDFGKNSEAGLELASDSAYSAVRDAIEARTRASQQAPTPTEVFARKMVAAVTKPNPRHSIRIGNGSRLLPFMERWIPRRLLDRLLSRRFHLNRL